MWKVVTFLGRHNLLLVHARRSFWNFYRKIRVTSSQPTSLVFGSNLTLSKHSKSWEYSTASAGCWIWISNTNEALLGCYGCHFVLSHLKLMVRISVAPRLVLEDRRRSSSIIVVDLLCAPAAISCYLELARIRIPLVVVA